MLTTKRQPPWWPGKLTTKPRTCDLGRQPILATMPRVSRLSHTGASWEGKKNAPALSTGPEQPLAKPSGSGRVIKDFIQPFSGPEGCQAPHDTSRTLRALIGDVLFGPERPALDSPRVSCSRGSWMTGTGWRRQEECPSRVASEDDRPDPAMAQKSASQRRDHPRGEVGRAQASSASIPSLPSPRPASGSSTNFVGLASPVGRSARAPRCLPMLAPIGTGSRISGHPYQTNPKQCQPTLEGGRDSAGR